ncbi:MAG: S-layer homology domain-containing protein [Oscillospiraceae bacterium]|nr:S-layer homology domain-containing protein [Oscillospiraceae bacterium]
MSSKLSRRLTALCAAGILSFTLSALPTASALFGSNSDEEPVAVSAFSKNGPVTGTISFSPDDFQVMGDAELSSIILTSLPDSTAGILTMGQQPIPEGSEISMSAVNGLTFIPLAAPEVSSTSFTFTPVFDRGLMGEAVTVGLFLLKSENSAPVAENLSLCTYKCVEVQGTFAAVDPEGDLLTFRIVTQPGKGTVTQAEDGSAAFTYTPNNNKTGKDAFTYVAVDSVGNTSAPATVNIRIEKQKTKVTYADMTGVEGHREAIHLAEEGLLIGEQVDGQYFFHPEEVMSRSQFTALALAVSGMDPLEGVTLTGFSDDEAIAVWAKPYVSAALRSGIVQGSATADGSVIFRSDEPITTAEAAVVLNRALRVTDVANVMAEGDSLWYAQAVANLDSCGAMPASAIPQEPLTRAQAAIMIDRAMELMENRNQKSWWPW